MNRREALQLFGAGSALAAGSPLAAAQSSTRGTGPVKITDVKTILVQPGSDFLVIVKVLTSEPGLYGIGCATHGERPLAVATAVNEYMKPFVMGKNVEDIEDIWQAA